MNELVSMQYEGSEVRMVVKDGVPWWVAKDVCAVLDLENTTRAVERLDEDEKGVSSIHTPGGDQEVLAVNEFGLYALILGSRKPEAKQFKRWVTHKVLPAIRKTGSYQLSTGQMTLVQQAEFMLSCAKKIEEQDFKVLAATDLAKEANKKAQAALDRAESNYGYFSVLGYWRLRGVDLTLTEASMHGRKLTEICNNMGARIDRVKDGRWGYVNSYPEGMLEEYFNRNMNREEGTEGVDTEKKQ
jgi:prophage antirepressor-like protein